MSLGKNGCVRARASRIASVLALPVALASSLVSAPALAAGPTGPISGWQKGTEPSWVSMYEYVPANLAPNAPVLVLVHYCGGNAGGVFGEAQGGGIVAAADKYGFLMVVPQTSRNCWDVATAASLTHGGGGDTGAIVDQVKYAITKHNANANRVYVTGTSSGAMMAEGLAAVYPEVFKGSSEFAGVPAGCWSVSDPDGQWSGPCAGGTVTHTADEWGTMARNMYPGYTGPRPRIQLWHGDADTTIKPANQTEAIKQWTNVLGLSTAPTSTMTVQISGKSYKREQWQDKCGSVALDAWTQLGGPHGTDANLNATYTIPFLALDQPGDVDPIVAKCGGSAGGGGSGTGGSASGGSSSSTGGQANPAGGSPSTGGQTSAGGTGTTLGTGGASGTATNPSTGTGGSGVIPSAGTGTSVAGTSDGTVMDQPGGPDVPPRPGCACDLAQRSSSGDALAWAGALAMSVVFGRRRRAKRSANPR
jgi:acetylxylan esterase